MKCHRWTFVLIAALEGACGSPGSESGRIAFVTVSHARGEVAPDSKELWDTLGTHMVVARTGLGADNAIFYSSDEGDSWRLLGTANAPIERIAFWNDSAVLVKAEGSSLFSIDIASAELEPLASQVIPITASNWRVVHPLDILFVWDENGNRLRWNKTGPWNSCANLPMSGSNHDLAIVQTDDVYVLTSNGLARSTDGCGTFEAGFISTVVNAAQLTADSDGDILLTAASGPGGVYGRLASGQSTVTQLADGPNAPVSAGKDGRFYAGEFRSLDGVTWNRWTSAPLLSPAVGFVGALRWTSSRMYVTSSKRLAWMSSASVGTVDTMFLPHALEETTPIEAQGRVFLPRDDGKFFVPDWVWDPMADRFEEGQLRTFDPLTAYTRLPDGRFFSTGTLGDYSSDGGDTWSGERSFTNDDPYKNIGDVQSRTDYMAVAPDGTVYLSNIQVTTNGSPYATTAVSDDGDEFTYLTEFEVEGLGTADVAVVAADNDALYGVATGVAPGQSMRESMRHVRSTDGVSWVRYSDPVPRYPLPDGRYVGLADRAVRVRSLDGQWSEPLAAEFQDTPIRIATLSHVDGDGYLFIELGHRILRSENPL